MILECDRCGYNFEKYEEYKKYSEERFCPRCKTEAEIETPKQKVLA